MSAELHLLSYEHFKSTQWYILDGLEKEGISVVDHPFEEHAERISDIPLYWLSPGEGWEALYTLGPTHVLNLSFLKGKLVLVDEYYSKANWKDSLAGFLLRMHRRAFFLPPSTMAYEFQRHVLPEERVRIAPAIMRRPRGKPRLPEEVKEALGREYILYVGRPERIKRPWIVVEMAKRMPEETFVMVGMEITKGKFSQRGDQETLNAVLREKSDNLIILGRVSRDVLYFLYKNASLTLLTSERESVGSTVSESLSVGTPVLATDGLPFSNVLPRLWRVSRTSNAGVWVERARRILLDDSRSTAEEIAEKHHLILDDYHEETVEALTEFLS